MHVLLLALAALWAWEYLLLLCPLPLPPWLQPLLVAGMCYGVTHLPSWALLPMALAGAVALLHRLVTLPEVTTVLRRRPGRVPHL